MLEAREAPRFTQRGGEGSKNGMRKASVVPTIQRDHVLYLTGDGFKNKCTTVCEAIGECQIVFRNAESKFRWVSVLCLDQEVEHLMA